jgi:predicted nuclease of predicted toxin-antitoxin system
MRTSDLALLADENIHPDVIRALREKARDVRSIQEDHPGANDHTVLRIGHAEGRVVLTHDLDFGTLAIRDRAPFTGIICVRPGHISPAFVLDLLAAAEAAHVDVEAPFILVIERRASGVRIRLRRF